MRLFSLMLLICVAVGAMIVYSHQPAADSPAIWQSPVAARMKNIAHWLNPFYGAGPVGSDHFESWAVAFRAGWRLAVAIAIWFVSASILLEKKAITLPLLVVSLPITVPLLAMMMGFDINPFHHLGSTVSGLEYAASIGVFVKKTLLMIIATWAALAGAWVLLVSPLD